MIEALWILFPNEPPWFSVLAYIFLNPMTAVPTILSITAITVAVFRTRRRKAKLDSFNQ